MPDRNKNNAWIILLLITLMVIFLLIISFFSDIIAIITLSILASMLFNPFVSFLEHKGFDRIFAVVIIFILSGLFLFVIGSVLMPKLIKQINSLPFLLNEENISKITGGFESIIRKYFPFLKSNFLVEKLKNIFNSIFIELIDNFSGIVSSLLNIIIILVIIPFITFFILRDNKLIMKSFINLVPNRYFEFSYKILNEIGFQLGKYIRGWILDALIVGTFVFIGVSFLGIDNSFTIGFIAGIGHLVPYFGPLIGGIPAIILSLVQFGDLSKLPEILILFILIYTIDNGLIQPKIYASVTGLHPILIIVLVLAGNQMLGPLGMLLAIPVATIIKTASTEFYYGYKQYKIIKM